LTKAALVEEMPLEVPNATATAPASSAKPMSSRGQPKAISANPSPLKSAAITV
jgi:hypothetical protein